MRNTLGRRRTIELATLAIAIATAGWSAACRREAAPPPTADAARAAIAAVMPAPPEMPPTRGNHIALLYSSNVRGEYEPCG